MDATKIHGIERLIAQRNCGEHPAMVFIAFAHGGWLSSRDYGISPAANINRLDLRPFVGLDVFVIAETYSHALAHLFTRLQDYASAVTYSVTAWLPDDLGVTWVRGHGSARKLGEPPETAE